MTRKQVPVIFLVCRHNQQEWQQYTTARAQVDAVLEHAAASVTTGAVA